MKVGFLILNYNSFSITERLAKKVAAFESIDLVVIVDNGSTDDSYIRLQKNIQDNIIVLKSNRNGGYSYGNNFGAKFCEERGCDILFISNPDVDIEEKDIQKILCGFAGDKYSVLSAIEYNGEGEKSTPAIWKVPRYIDDVMDCFFLGRKLHRIITMLQSELSETIAESEMVRGSFLAVQVADFVNAGGFDENVFLFCEERILAKRMKRLGMRIGVVTDAVYVHNHSTVIDKAYRRRRDKIDILYKSRLYYYYTYEKISRLKTDLLKLCMLLSLCEYYVFDKLMAINQS